MTMLTSGTEDTMNALTRQASGDNVTSADATEGMTAGHLPRGYR